MQIVGASSYRGSAPTALPARPPSTYTSPELARTRQSPALPGHALDDGQWSPTRKEVDRSAGSPQHGARSPQQRSEQLQVAELASRDQEVRAHEQAHAAVGGSYAGTPSYTYKRGPDGKRYAVGGEVAIDAAVVPNDPQATLAKMETVMRAALAPAAPSAQDLRVAARARAQMVQARTELLAERREQADATPGQRGERADTGESAPTAGDQPQASQPALELYRQAAGGQDVPGMQVDLVV